MHRGASTGIELLAGECPSGALGFTSSSPGFSEYLPQNWGRSRGDERVGAPAVRTDHRSSTTTSKWSMSRGIASSISSSSG